MLYRIIFKNWPIEQIDALKILWNKRKAISESELLKYKSVLIIFSGDPLTPKYRVLGERPVFTLHSLELNKDYQVVVYAENAKGKSNPPVVLPNVRIKSINGEIDRSDINRGGLFVVIFSKVCLLVGLMWYWGCMKLNVKL